MKILFLIPYPLGVAPSQRFRFEQYFKVLNNKGHHYEVQSFLNSQDWKIFFLPGNLFRKIRILLSGFLRRIGILFKVKDYDFIFIHREASPVGPPIIEWLVSRVFKKRIIYDFDDAIWFTDRKNESLILKAIKWRRKVAGVCKWSYKISCGNEYLLQFSQQHNRKVFLNPTTIDTENLHNPDKFQKTVTEKIIVGWTGSHSTVKYLDSLGPVLQSLENKYPQLEYWIIADRPPALQLKSLQFKRWSLETEIVHLLQFDIGIMPLPDDEWAKGKCGFKALQYMALQIPTVASPVGVNTQIIKHGENGLLCRTLEDWENALGTLIENTELRKSIGEAGRKTIADNYSVSSNSSNFISLFS